LTFAAAGGCSSPDDIYFKPGLDYRTPSGILSIVMLWDDRLLPGVGWKV
jgi:hypothetical protein